MTLLPVWMRKYSLYVYTIICDTINASALLHIVSEYFPIQERLVFIPRQVQVISSMVSSMGESCKRK